MEFKHLLYLVCGILASFMGRSIAAHGGGDPGMWILLAIPVITVFVLLTLDIRALVLYGPGGKPRASQGKRNRDGVL